MTSSPRLTRRFDPSADAQLEEVAPAFIRTEESLDSVVVDGAGSGMADSGSSALDWSHTAFLESVIRGISCESLSIAEAHFTSCRLEGIATAEVLAKGAGMEGVRVEACRFGALTAIESTFQRVEFVGCKIDYLNLRAAKFRDVRFRDCVIGEFDGVGADLMRLDFPDTSIQGLSLHSSHVKDVDVRSAHLRGIKDVSGLAGVTMSGEQVEQLAPAFARHLRIRVE